VVPRLPFRRMAVEVRRDRLGDYFGDCLIHVKDMHAGSLLRLHCATCAALPKLKGEFLCDLQGNAFTQLLLEGCHNDSLLAKFTVLWLRAKAFQQTGKCIELNLARFAPLRWKLCGVKRNCVSVPIEAQRTHSKMAGLGLGMREKDRHLCSR
jgi:hypothetical protein